MLARIPAIALVVWVAFAAMIYLTAGDVPNLWTWAFVPTAISSPFIVIAVLDNDEPICGCSCHRGGPDCGDACGSRW